MPDPTDLRIVTRLAAKARQAITERNTAIRAARAAGMPVRAIATAAGTTHPTILKIVKDDVDV